jgi:predicted Zn finger-like uncharacterized protein
MRLICPNCDAQYDIADDVIPEGGRDVQCSNCTHTWFQTDKPKITGRTTPILTPTTPTTTARTSTGVRERKATPSRPVMPTRKPLDSSIADILREEADHANVQTKRPNPVTAAAEAPTAAIEAPDTSADEAEQRSADTRMRISRMSEQDVASSDASAVRTRNRTSRSQRTIPTIDEINDTLSGQIPASGEASLTEAEQQDAVKRRGFRRGFAMVLILIGVAILPYVFAGEIVELLPESREYLVQYVDAVDQLRVQLRESAIQLSTLVQDLIPSNAPAETAPAVTSDG